VTGRFAVESRPDLAYRRPVSLVGRGALVFVVMAAVPACELFASLPDYSVDPELTVDGGFDPDATDAPAAECETTAQCSAPEVCVMGDCRACDDDAHCGDPSANVCLPDGTCAAPGRIAYASPGGAGAQCTLAAPCALEQAFAAAAASGTIDIVKLIPGAYPRATGYTFAGDIAILAGQGATLTATSPVQMIRVESGNLTIVGVELVGNQQFNTLCIPQTGQPATMSLYRVLSRGGAYGTGGFNCALNITRSTLTQSSNLAVYAQQGTARISSSVILGNGGPSNAAGGISFVNCPDGKIELSTIAANTTAGPDLAAGIDCAGSTVTVTSSIIWGNTGPTTITPACAIDYSIVEPTYAAGAHNVRSDPMFLGAGDFHISAASPARGIADPALTAPTLDRDGEPRPQGGTVFDVGADEIP